MERGVSAAGACWYRGAKLNYRNELCFLVRMLLGECPAERCTF